MSASRAGLAAALVAGVLAVGAPGAAAQHATSDEVRALAARAASDPAARAELERLQTVDGRSVDLEQALAGTHGDELAERLEVLAGGEADRAPDAGAARAQARDVLSERRFHEPATPRPFRGALAWLGERLRPLSRAVDWLAARVPGGESVVWALLAGTVLLVAGLVAGGVARRRVGRALERAAAERTPAAADPRRLEREADEAERRGELERALRLRFRAGLLRLDRAEAVPFRDSLTTGDVARRLRSREFDRVAATFDEVVYGGRPPTGDDVRTTREGWKRVFEDVTSR